MAVDPGSRHIWNPSDIAAAMMKEKNIHEGLWMVLIEFRVAGLNTGPTPEEMFPSVVVPITGVGIIKVDETGPLVFDAAVINPSQLKIEKEKLAKMKRSR